jgi:hypothetical protein
MFKPDPAATNFSFVILSFTYARIIGKKVSVMPAIKVILKNNFVFSNVVEK